MVLINGKIYTMDNRKIIENGYIVISEGKIVSVEQGEYTGSDIIIDCNGGYVLPGLIDAHSHIGMWEDSLGFEGADGNEMTDPLTPQLRAIDAINPMDRAFGEALAGGVTTVATGPGSANVMGGQFVAIKTHGSVIDNMVRKCPIAQKAALGENPKTVYHNKEKTPSTRMASASLLREMLEKTKNYINKKKDFDVKCESLVDVIKRKLPLKVHVHRADDIFTAIRIAKEFDIDITLEHCTEGHLIINELKDAGYKIAIGPFICDRSKPELKNLSVKAGSIYERAGIDISIITDHPITPQQYLVLCAAVAHREGMSEMAALESITINAAKHIGLQDKIGTISVGKDADIVVFDKHPFDIMSKVTTVIIEGVNVL